MSAVTAADASVLIFRIGLGVVFLAHGYNHIFGGGKIAGTARWFESLGMRPGIALAWFSPPGWLGLGIAVIGGAGSAAGLLAICWRPGDKIRTTN